MVCFCGNLTPYTALLRVLTVLSFFFSGGLLALGIVIQSPPVSGLPVGLVCVGAVSTLFAGFGIVASWRFTCALHVHAVFGTLCTLGQTALAIAMFVGRTPMVNAIASHEVSEDPTWQDDASNLQRLQDTISVGRWIVAAAAAIGAASVLANAALVVFAESADGSGYDAFDDEAPHPLARVSYGAAAPQVAAHKPSIWGEVR